MSEPASLDGEPVFGVANHVVHNPHPNAQQINAFFGMSGMQTLFGGTRGRTFMISGVFLESSLEGIVADEANLLNFADGQTHTLVDTLGRSWSNVIFRGEYQASPDGPRPAADQGWLLPFKCVLEALT